MKPGRKKFFLELSEKVVKDVNLELVKIYGRTYGHFARTVEDGLVLWVEKQRVST